MAIPLIASSTEAVLAQLGALSPASRALASAFWPGPLSLIVDAPASIARAVHAGRGTVAVRVPALPLAREVAGRFHGLVTATSANRSGEPAARTVAEAGAIARDPRVHVVDGGATTGGAASTIVDARGDTPVLIRAGAIAWDRVLESLKK
jgi:tRNA threonylcarbamoyl adenosine modification protein (Sua5/YciO/YrdC/YwlC family)